MHQRQSCAQDTGGNCCADCCAQASSHQSPDAVRQSKRDCRRQNLKHCAYILVARVVHQPLAEDHFLKEARGDCDCQAEYLEKRWRSRLARTLGRRTLWRAEYPRRELVRTTVERCARNVRAKKIRVCGAATNCRAVWLISRSENANRRHRPSS